MKIRNSFVSNSSTSSYICDVCGEEKAGRDLCLSEAEMFQCTMGHTVCESCWPGNPFYHLRHASREEQIKFLQEDAPSWYNKDNYEEMDQRDLEACLDDALSDVRHEMPSSFCPCCKLEIITEDDEILYLRARCNMSKEEVHKEIRAQFDDRKDMMEKLDANKKSSSQ